jgi:predicted aspartyl protease
MSDVGTFRITVEVENPLLPGTRRQIHNVLVDTGAELSVFPADVLDALRIEREEKRGFRQANGTVFERWIGTVRIYAAGRRVPDFVVFGEKSDIVLLGAHSIEGLNFRVEPITKQLVDAGPMLLAAAS